MPVKSLLFFKHIYFLFQTTNFRRNQTIVLTALSIVKLKSLIVDNKESFLMTDLRQTKAREQVILSVILLNYHHILLWYLAYILVPPIHLRFQHVWFEIETSKNQHSTAGLSSIFCMRSTDYKRVRPLTPFSKNQMTIQRKISSNNRTVSDKRRNNIGKAIIYKIKVLNLYELT